MEPDHKGKAQVPEEGWVNAHQENKVPTNWITTDRSGKKDARDQGLVEGE